MTGGEVFDRSAFDTSPQPKRDTLDEIRRGPPFANPETAMAKLLEVANGLEADHTGPRSIGAINPAFLSAGGNVNEPGAAMHHAVDHGWLESHPSGAYLKLTQNGAGRFA
jgi:hypothetical protein